MTLYRVVGSSVVRGIAPGGTFKADPDELGLWALLEAGHIQEVTVHRFKAGEFTEEDAPLTEEGD